MKSIVKRGGFGVLMAVVVWCVAGCSWMVWDDDQTFDEMAVIEFEVDSVSVWPNFKDDLYDEPFPYRACQNFCVIGKISLERNPFFSTLNGELVKRQPPMLNRHCPLL